MELPQSDDTEADPNDGYVRLGFASNTCGRSATSGAESSDEVSSFNKSVNSAKDGHRNGKNVGENNCCFRLFPNGFTADLREILRVAWPVVLSQVSQTMFSFVATIFCGRLGDVVQLDAVSLANSLMNVTGVAVAIGLSSACDTLFAQTYGSANKMYMGVILQRSLIIMGLASFPCMALHLNAEPVLILLGQDPLVARYTSEYLTLFLPAVPSFFITVVLTKYLQNMNKLYPPMIIAIAANLVNALLHFIFVTVMEQQLWGSALAQMLSFVLQCVCVAAYILISGACKKAWGGWSKECLQEWGPFFKLAFWGMIMTCVEWWAFEIGVFLTGVLGSVELGAQTVAFQYDSIWYQIPYGIGVAASIVVGHRLGAGDKPGAVTATNVSLTIIGVICPVVGIIFAVFRGQLPLLFTDIPDVVALAATILPIVGLYLIFDGTACVCGGILRGCGRQHAGALIIFTGYVVGLGMGIPLMFLTPLGLLGLWIGLASALMVESIIMLILVQCSNWDKEIKNAQIRAKTEPSCDTLDSERSTGQVHKHGKSMDDTKSSSQSDASCRKQSQIDFEDEARKPLLGSSKVTTITTQLLYKRIVVVSVLFAILTAGIILRLTFEPNPIDLPGSSPNSSTVRTVTFSGLS